MSVTTAPRGTPGTPGVIDALGLLPTIVGNEIVLATVRDTHKAWAGRIHGLLNRASGDRTRGVQVVHDGISAGVYGSISLGLSTTGMALKTAGRLGMGPRLDDSPRGRFVRAAVNGLIGDRFVTDGSSLAIDMGVRLAGADVPLCQDRLSTAFPDATPRIDRKSTRL